MKPFLKICGIILFSWGVLTAAQGKAQDMTTQTAIFAGGCFWCIEKDAESLDGVLEVVSGYTGGQVKDPSYKQVSRGGTGHYEAVEVTYDPSLISYNQLLKMFWRSIDPHDAHGQFCDKGDQYRAGIFYKDEDQKVAAEASKKALEESGALKEPIVTEIMPASTFFNAEHYHQDYHKKNPIRYKYYRSRCGRDDRTQDVWGDVDLDQILGD